MFQEVIRHEIARDALDYVLDSTVKIYVIMCLGNIYVSFVIINEKQALFTGVLPRGLRGIPAESSHLLLLITTHQVTWRDALPVHETEMPEMCLPLRKRPCRTTPGPGYEVGESSTAGTARQVGPTTAEADLYGFTDLFRAAPDAGCSREFRLWFWDNGMTLLEPPRDCTDHPRGGQPESY
ncbi:hypothetical protein Tco_0749520 [Tanacetum coccineum]|uniref:Uncharacterized protein n=1 Tax=Tanacetum coccineum TaxID=301880 RepID=A0ABQ4YYQ6_9ASTR